MNRGRRRTNGSCFSNSFSSFSSESTSVAKGSVELLYPECIMMTLPMATLLVLTLILPVHGWVVDPLDSTPPLAACGGWGPEPCAFGDNAVLSSSTPFRGGVSPARIFGGGVAGEKITITGLPEGAVVSPSNPFLVSTGGNWSITLATPDSPAFFNLTFTGTQKSVTLHNVRFGLTWLCSGQVCCFIPMCHVCDDPPLKYTIQAYPYHFTQPFPPSPFFFFSPFPLKSNMDMMLDNCFYANETVASS